MANWVKIANTTKTFTCAAGGVVASGNVHTWIEYDKDRTTPLQTYIRFRGKPISSSKQDTTTYTDAFYVLYNPNNDPASIGRKMLCIKYYNYSWASVPDYNELKITKAYTDKGFYIQDYWICNNGKNAQYVAATVLKPANINTMYEYFTTTRRNYVCKTHAGSTRYLLNDKDGNSTVCTAVGPPTLVSDKCYCGASSSSGTTKMKVTWTKGKNGDNNLLDNENSYMYYKRPNDVEWQKLGGIYRTVESNGTFSLSVDYSTTGTGATHAAKAFQKVELKAILKSEWGPDITVSFGSLTVPSFVYPEVVSPPTLHLRTSNNRLTTNNLCYFTWPAVPDRNGSSKIKGYRIRLYKKDRGSSTWNTVTGLTYRVDDKLTGDKIDSTDGGRYSLALRYAQSSTHELYHNYEYIHLEDGYNSNGYTFDFSHDFSAPFINVNLSEGVDPNDPSKPFFKVGDAIKLGVYAYTEVDSFSNPGTKLLMFSGGGSSGNQSFSTDREIQNSGVVYVKTSDDPGGWVLGTVYVKTTDEPGGWVAAESISIKTADGAGNWVETC